LFVGNNIKTRVPILKTNGSISNETYDLVTSFVCIARSEYKQYFRFYLPISDLLFVAIIPFLLIMFTNIGIIRIAMRSNTSRTSSRRQKRNNRLTIMLLSVILAFMLLTCPSFIYISLNRLALSTRFSDRKHALNFILYILSGRDFRREFRKLIPCSKRTSSNTLRHRRQDEPCPISMDSYVFRHSSS
jgi:hypothetical protein